MMIYLKNTTGYKMDFFKGMSYDEICPIFQARFDENMRFLFKSGEEMEEEDQEVLKSVNETPAQKAAKRRKLNEEAEDLKKRLEVVDDEDDDVFTEATPLARKKAAKRRRLNEEAKHVEELKRHLEIMTDDVYTEATLLSRKVPVVDYQIIHFNNKPHYKIIHADGTHRLYVSFITLLKNFDREDLESLWSLVKERFSTSNLNNFSGDYLLTMLREMFGRPDGQDQI
nr:hypothetical protein [Tanacetum cinerariifolium]